MANKSNQWEFGGLKVDREYAKLTAMTVATVGCWAGIAWYAIHIHWICGVFGVVQVAWVLPNMISAWRLEMAIRRLDRDLK